MKYQWKEISLGKYNKDKDMLIEITYLQKKLPKLLINIIIKDTKKQIICSLSDIDFSL
jgi:hypothetical protein